MSRVALYLMNFKGLTVLEKLINDEDTIKAIDFVVGGKDDNIENDYYHDIKLLCEKMQIRFFDRKDKIPDFRDYKLAIGWRWLIAENEKLIVFHDSILPKYRGFNPMVTSLINGDSRIGVTAIYATHDYDSGEIIEQEIKLVQYPLKIRDAIEIVANLYSEIALIIVKKIARDKVLLSYPQDDAVASYSLWRDEEDYRIDWNWDAEYIKRFIDATGYPYKGATSTMEGKRIRIKNVFVEDDVVISNRDVGKIIFLRNGIPTVVCGNGLLSIVEAVFDQDQVSILPITKFRLRFK